MKPNDILSDYIHYSKIRIAVTTNQKNIVMIKTSADIVEDISSSETGKEVFYVKNISKTKKPQLVIHLTSKNYAGFFSFCFKLTESILNALSNDMMIGYESDDVNRKKIVISLISKRQIDLLNLKIKEMRK